MKGKRSYAGLVLIGLVIFLGVALALLPSGGSELEKSALSAEPDGRRALFLLMGELGFPARIWTGAPAELPRGEGLLWLPAVPKYPAGLAELAELEAPSEQFDSTLGLHNPAHYRRFLDEGGSVLCALAEPGMAEFVETELGVSVPELSTLDKSVRRDSKLLMVRTGEVLKTPAVARFDIEDWRAMPEASFEGWVRSSAETTDRSTGRRHPALVRVPVGRGSLLLLVTDAAFANQALREGEHALLAVRIAERFAAQAPILFDEYALGRWTPGSIVSVATSPELILFSAHLLLALFLFVWYRGWVRAFPRDPKPVEPLSALARVKSCASLFQRAGRLDLLALELRSGVLRELHRRGIRGRAVRVEEFEASVVGLLGPTAGADEVSLWTERLRVGVLSKPDELDQFKAKLDDFAERIRLGRVHASKMGKTT